MSFGEVVFLGLPSEPELSRLTTEIAGNVKRHRRFGNRRDCVTATGYPFSQAPFLEFFELFVVGQLLFSG
jgi:hypothetical protein